MEIPRVELRLKRKAPDSSSSSSSSISIPDMKTLDDLSLNATARQTADIILPVLKSFSVCLDMHTSQLKLLQALIQRIIAQQNPHLEFLTWKKTHDIFFHDAIGVTIQKLYSDHTISELIKMEPKKIDEYLLFSLEKDHKVVIPPHLMKELKKNLRELFSNKKYEIQKMVGLAYIEIGKKEGQIITGELNENGPVQEQEQKRLDPEEDLETIQKVLGKLILGIFKKNFAFYAFSDEFWTKLVNETLEICTGPREAQYAWLYQTLHRFRFQDISARERPKFKLSDWVEAEKE